MGRRGRPKRDVTIEKVDDLGDTATRPEDRDEFEDNKPEPEDQEEKTSEDIGDPFEVPSGIKKNIKITKKAIYLDDIISEYVDTTAPNWLLTAMEVMYSKYTVVAKEENKGRRIYIVEA